MTTAQTGAARAELIADINAKAGGGVVTRQHLLELFERINELNYPDAQVATWLAQNRSVPLDGDSSLALIREVKSTPQHKLERQRVPGHLLGPLTQALVDGLELRAAS